MTWGRGYGVPFGGGPLIPTSQPLAEIAGPPTGFDLTDDPDGPLPGHWEFYALTDDGLGSIDGEAEPNPSVYYRVSNGLGLWAYQRAPLTGTPFVERGVAASPSGVLEGRDARLSAVFRSPLLLRERSVDSFKLEIALGARLVDAGTTFVGGRVRAEWDAANGWTLLPLALDVVRGDGGPLSVIATAPLPDLPDLTDIWANSPDHELEIELRGDALTARLGVVEVTGAVPATGPAKALVLARIFNQTGALIEAPPAFKGFAFSSLRDLDNLGPAPQIPGDRKVYEHPLTPTQRILGAELQDGTRWKRIGARQFEAKTDLVSRVGQTAAVFNAGDVIRVTEKFVGQFLIGYVPDLATIRGRK